MPHRDLLSCFIEIGESCSRLREYGTTYNDRTCETYIAIPSKPTPFSIRLTTKGYVAPGLAVYVFIDGVYQTNRNRRGVTPDNGRLEYHLGQKEDLLKDGRVIARGWWFEKLNIVSDKTKPTVNDDVLNNLGVIEVVVLRCEDDPSSIPVDPWSFPQLPSLQQHREVELQGSTAKTQEKGSKKNDSAEENPPGRDLFGGMFGIFDGAFNEPPRRPQFGLGLDGHCDLNDWIEQTVQSIPHAHVTHQHAEFADDATPTSSADSGVEKRHRKSRRRHDRRDESVTKSVERRRRSAYGPGQVRFVSDKPDASEQRARIDSHHGRRHNSPRSDGKRRAGREPLPRDLQARLEEALEGIRDELQRPQRKYRSPSPRPLGSPEQQADRHLHHRTSRRERKRASTPKPHRKVLLETATESNSDTTTMQSARLHDNSEASDNMVRKTIGTRIYPRYDRYNPEVRYQPVEVPAAYQPIRGSNMKELAPMKDCHQSSNQTTFMNQLPHQFLTQEAVKQFPLSNTDHNLPYAINHVRTYYDRPWPHTEFYGGPWYPSQPAHQYAAMTTDTQEQDDKEELQTKEKIARLEEQLQELKASRQKPWARYVYGASNAYQSDHKKGMRGRKYFYKLPFENPWQHRSTRGRGPRRRSRSSSPGSDSASTTDSSKDAQGNNKSASGWVAPNAAEGGASWGASNTQNNDGQPSWMKNRNTSKKKNANHKAGGDTAISSRDTNKDDASNAGGTGTNACDQDGDNNDQQSQLSKSSERDVNHKHRNGPDNNVWGQTQTWTSNNKKDDGKAKSEKEKEKQKTKSSKKKGDESSSSSTSEEEKPYTRSYWTSQVRSGRARSEANSSRKRDRYTMPEDPIYTISKAEADEKKLKHQVRGGKGAEQKRKSGASKPLYWDNFDEPFVVFRFKYRSRDMLKKILGEDVKETKEEYKEWLNALSKEQLVAEMLRKKDEGGSDSDETEKKGDASAQTQGPSSWDAAGDSGAIRGDWDAPQATGGANGGVHWNSGEAGSGGGNAQGHITW